MRRKNDKRFLALVVLLCGLNLGVIFYALRLMSTVAAFVDGTARMTKYLDERKIPM